MIIPSQSFDPVELAKIDGVAHYEERSLFNLMLLRDLCREPAGRGLLDKLVLLAAPIYNIDGNEDLKPQAEHRSHQFGPEMVGRRSNEEYDGRSSRRTRWIRPESVMNLPLARRYIRSCPKRWFRNSNQRGA